MAHLVGWIGTGSGRPIETWIGHGLQAAAPLVAATALIVSGLVLVASRSPATALGSLLDLLLAAGLLRLSADADAGALASAAVVLIIRKIASFGIAVGRDRDGTRGQVDVLTSRVRRIGRRLQAAGRRGETREQSRVVGRHGPNEA